jgi:hypothetical protein
MTEMTARFALPFLQSGQAQKELYHNEALALIDIALQPVVQANGINEPPLSPGAGECWIVGPSPTGAWSGRGGALAGWTGGGWRFVSASQGMSAWCIADTMWVRYIGDTWVVGKLPATSIWIGGRQVLGDQRPTIANPSGGETTDIEGRTAIISILEAMRGHGLIAS